MAGEITHQSEHVWMALAAFTLLAALGPALGWSNGDLLWGLLVTSLATCIIGAVLGVVSLLFFFFPWRLAGRIELMNIRP